MQFVFTEKADIKLQSNSGSDQDHHTLFPDILNASTVYMQLFILLTCNRPSSSSIPGTKAALGIQPPA